MAEASEEFSYDTVPYGSRVFPHSGPDRLATVATLFGLAPTRPENCRALELGCGDGSNLIAMAYSLPKSSFLGIDLSTVHVDQARATAASLNLGNIEFIQADASKLSSHEIGHFDFISAHGLISWVPEPVREAILALCSDCLKENGVGYLSYNTYPGAYLRRIAWDMMRFHSSSEKLSSDMVARGRDILNFVASASAPDSYGTSIREEARRLAERDDANVFHDDLAVENRPFYFYEFDALLNRHELQYLGEANLDTRLMQQIAPGAIEVIDKFAGEDRSTREQYIDFLVGRRFRASLFCRGGREVAVWPTVENLRGLSFASQLSCPAGSSLTGGEPLEFVNPEGSSITVSNRATKHALTRMAESFPKAINWGELNDDTTEVDVEVLALDLIALYEFNLVSFCSFQSPFASEVRDRPVVSELARYQIANGARGATSLLGHNVEITQPAVRQLLVLLDGTRTQANVLEELLRLMPAEQRSPETVDQLRGMISGNLEVFLRNGLLEA